MEIHIFPSAAPSFLSELSGDSGTDERRDVLLALFSERELSSSGGEPGQEILVGRLREASAAIFREFYIRCENLQGLNDTAKDLRTKAFIEDAYNQFIELISPFSDECEVYEILDQALSKDKTCKSLNDAIISLLQKNYLN